MIAGKLEKKTTFIFCFIFFPFLNDLVFEPPPFLKKIILLFFHFFLITWF